MTPLPATLPAPAPVRPVAPDAAASSDARPTFEAVRAAVRDASDKPKSATTAETTEDDAQTDAAPAPQPQSPPLAPVTLLLAATATVATQNRTEGALGASSVLGVRNAKGPTTTAPAAFLLSNEAGEEGGEDAADFANDLLAAIGNARAMTTIAVPTDQATTLSAPAPVVDAAPVLDLSSDAWLDQLARDITATASADGKLSFRIVPPSLGKLDINIETRDAGVAVHMKTETREAQAILSTAQPRLESALGAHGIRVAETSVASNGQDGNLPRPQFMPQKPAIEAVTIPENEADAPTTGRDAGRFA